MNVAVHVDHSAAIGEIIHDLDLRDGKFGREETSGVRSAIDGICTVSRGDDDRIAAASPRSLVDATFHDAPDGLLANWGTLADFRT